MCMEHGLVETSSLSDEHIINPKGSRPMLEQRHTSSNDMDAMAKYSSDARAAANTE